MPFQDGSTAPDGWLERKLYSRFSWHGVGLMLIRTNVCAEQMVADLQAWLMEAGQSGISALQQIGLRLRTVQV